MKKKKKIYEGNEKKIYETDESEHLIQEFKDSITSFNGEKKGVIKGKGVINNQISSHLFEYLEGFNIPTHFIKNLSNRDMLIKRMEMIPIEFHIYNITAGDLCQRLGLDEGKILDYPIVEYYFKNEPLQNPMINDSHAISLYYTKIEEINLIKRFTSKINAVLKSFFTRRGFKLVGFKAEFGRHKNKIVLGDEISLSSCRLWDLDTNDRFDLDISEHTTAEIEKSYEDIKNRIFQ